MAKHTQTIRRLLRLGVFDHFVELALKGLKNTNERKKTIMQSSLEIDLLLTFYLVCFS